MVALATAFMTFLGSATAKLLLDRLFLFLAIKALLTALFIIVLPIVLNNLVADMIQEAMVFVGSQPLDGSWGGVSEFTGLLGWLVDCLCLPEVLSITISALQLHLCLKLIPFSPVK